MVWKVYQSAAAAAASLHVVGRRRRRSHLVAESSVATSSFQVEYVSLSGCHVSG